jgi:hypothetical protein
MSFAALSRKAINACLVFLPASRQNQQVDGGEVVSVRGQGEAWQTAKLFHRNVVAGQSAPC